MAFLRNLSSMNSSSMQFFFFFNFTYNCVSWRPTVAFLIPIVAFFMELELHELKFHANFFFLSLIAPYTIFYKSSFTLKLNFEKIELQKRGISLISLENGAKHWFFCTKRAFVHFGHIWYNMIWYIDIDKTMYHQLCLLTIL